MAQSHESEGKCETETAAGIIRKGDFLIMKKKNIGRRLMSVALTLALAGSLLTGTGIMPVSQRVSAAFKLHNPTVANNGTTTWDCVWFGKYWQNDTNNDGTGNTQDKKEPVKWRVLSVKGDTVFLMADKNLDATTYYTYQDSHYDPSIETPLTWENSTYRSWLNGYGSAVNLDAVDYTADNFINAAFSEAEQKAILTTKLVNEDNPKYGTDGGNNTSDKLYLLALSDIENAAYGFTDNSTRTAANTKFASDQGALMLNIPQKYEGNGWWWLRTMGRDDGNAACVSVSGLIYDDGTGVTAKGGGVRPVFRLSLSAAGSLLSNAGTVCSDGTVKEVKPGKEKGETIIKDSKTKAEYAVTGKNTVEYRKPTKKTATVTIPDTIKADGVTYKVTSVAKNAFKGNTKMTKLVIGSNVKKIGANAFLNCKKLKNITIKTTKLTNASVGSKAFSGVAEKVTIKVPKSKLKAYKTLLQKKGVGKKAVFKKN